MKDQSKFQGYTHRSFHLIKARDLFIKEVEGIDDEFTGCPDDVHRILHRYFTNVYIANGYGL